MDVLFFIIAGKDKASKAAKAVKKSQWKKGRKPRFSVVFHRPRTLIRTRDPKVARIRYVYL
jgi:large subunit ribosomal protein L23Ae